MKYKINWSKMTSKKGAPVDSGTYETHADNKPMAKDIFHRSHPAKGPGVEEWYRIDGIERV